MRAAVRCATPNPSPSIMMMFLIGRDFPGEKPWAELFALRCGVFFGFFDCNDRNFRGPLPCPGGVGEGRGDRMRPRREIRVAAQVEPAVPRRRDAVGGQ